MRARIQRAVVQSIVVKVHMKVRDVIKRLEADGWYRIRSKSGHRQFKHADKKG
jgi:predicted RNA binding protein YcfA (HicA-like mRNA interferase family)